LIDLHTHTTASDGRCTPAELVAAASAAGVRVLSVTDHDTVAGYRPAAEVCAGTEIELVAGIEITAVRAGVDVHTLGYFIDVDSPALARFLDAQRHDRMNRIRAIVDRLRTHGIELDAEMILAPAHENAGRSAGRPWVARALVGAGHVATMNEAFSRWLSPGQPAFVPRIGDTPEQVIAHVHEAGGIASIAHPGTLAHDQWLPELVDAGLDAIEAYHTDHDGPTTARYLEFAARNGLAVSGGSDFHGHGSHGGLRPGTVSLPSEAFNRLKARRR
jgi:predicted metal-dependent phosphoesterase TrpH